MARGRKVENLWISEAVAIHIPNAEREPLVALWNEQPAGRLPDTSMTTSISVSSLLVLLW
jgi:hypothetical protein